MDHTLLVFPRMRYPSGDPPLGVAYLASCLRQAGHSVSIFDATFHRRPLERLADELLRLRPGLVAISALTSMVQDVAAVAELVSHVCPDAVVVVGGPHATVEPESTARLPGVDAVHVGEAEISLPALVANGLQYRGLQGYSYCECRDFIDGGSAPAVRDLDEIPYPAWDLLPMDKYLAHWYQLDAVAFDLRGTSIIASRGCPFNCAYCQPTLRTIFGNKIRRRSPDNIVGELSELKGRFGIEGVMWLDDTFLVDRKWMAELCRAMVEAGLGLLWGCNIRADLVDRESLLMMKEAGLRVAHIGIESATQRILDDIYMKGITVQQAEEAVHLARDVGLSVRGYFMLGAPTETEQEAWVTVDLANRLPLDDASFSITTPLPHTHLWDKTRELVGQEMEQFDYYKVPVYKEGVALPARRLVRIKRAAFLRFYLGRKRLWRTVRSMLSVSGVRKALLKVQRF